MIQLRFIHLHRPTLLRFLRELTEERFPETEILEIRDFLRSRVGGTGGGCPAAFLWGGGGLKPTLLAGAEGAVIGTEGGSDLALGGNGGGGGPFVRTGTGGGRARVGTGGGTAAALFRRGGGGGGGMGFLGTTERAVSEIQKQFGIGKCVIW